jgi:hypothetical protein
VLYIVINLKQSGKLHPGSQQFYVDLNFLEQLCK